jgi:hypothetical protein
MTFQPNKIKITTPVLLIMGLFLFMNSCTKDSGPLIINPPPVPGDTMISYSAVIQPFLDLHCVRCHNQSHPFLDLREEVSYDQLLFSGRMAPYVDTIDTENSSFIGRLRGVEFPIMPPDGGAISESTIDTIATWMLQGARNN